MADNRVYEQGALPNTPPPAAASPSIGYPTDGDPVSGTPATVPGAQWFHQIGEELRAVIVSAGLTPDPVDLGQLLAALQANYAHLDANGEVAQRPAGAASVSIGHILAAGGSWADFTGMVIPVAANVLPAGFVKCHGAALSRVTYANLFAKIGTVFGAGDGATTFNVPDLRGEFIRGWDAWKGTDAGRVFGDLQLDEFKSHTHGISSKTLTNVTGGALNVGSTYVSPWGQTSAVGGNETRPRNIAMMYCIKY